MHHPHFPPRLRPPSGALAFAIAAALGSAHAGEIQTDVTDLSLRWDNTFKYSAARRLNDADPALASDANQGDGDTNFRKAGLISSRWDWLSEAELKYQGYGLRLSGAAWRDALYLRTNRNDTAGIFGPGTSAVNSTLAPAYNEFSPDVRKTHGRHAEVLDAFVSARLELGDTPVTLRLGQHTVVWGESLFFGDNAIAGTTSSVDVAKAVSVPNLRFQEILRPVPQASWQVQISDKLTALGFYQFRFKGNRLPQAGSYFSPVDFGPGSNAILTPTGPMLRTPDRGERDGGQAGLGLRLRGDETDLGIYAVRFHSKNPIVVTNITNGTHYLQWHTGTSALGASASRSVGNFNLAAEASLRSNQELLSPNAYDAGGGARYAVGRTAHLNLSAFASGLGRSALWDDAMLLGELAWTRVLSVTNGADTMSGCTPAFFPGTVCHPNATRDTLRVQGVFEPVYYQVIPGLDLRVPLGLSYMPEGSRNSFGPVAGAEGGGSVNLGLSATWLDTWRIGLSATHYFGRRNVLFSPIGPAPTQAWNYGQTLRDRNYVSFVISRTL